VRTHSLNDDAKRVGEKSPYPLSRSQPKLNQGVIYRTLRTLVIVNPCDNVTLGARDKGITSMMISQYVKKLIVISVLYLVLAAIVFAFLVSYLPQKYPAPPYPVKAVENLLSGFLNWALILETLFAAMIAFFGRRAKVPLGVTLLAFTLLITALAQFIFFYEIYAAWAFDDQSRKYTLEDLMVPTLSFWLIMILSVYSLILIAYHARTTENRVGASIVGSSQARQPIFPPNRGSGPSSARTIDFVANPSVENFLTIGS